MYELSTESLDLGFALVDALHTNEGAMALYQAGISPEMLHDEHAPRELLAFQNDFIKKYGHPAPATVIAEHFVGFETREPQVPHAYLIERLRDRHLVIQLFGTIDDALRPHRGDPVAQFKALQQGIARLAENGFRNSESDASPMEHILDSELPVFRFGEHPIVMDEWLKPGILLKGAINFIIGDGGLGKSTTALGFVAELSRKGIHSLFMSAEDSPSVIRKRLEAAGANMGCVHGLDLWQFSDLRTDIDVLHRVVLKYEIQLLVLDPLDAFLPADTDSHRNLSVRTNLKPLQSLLNSTGLTVLGIHHITKDEKAHAGNRMMGSAAYKNLSRNVLAFGIYPGDPEKRALVFFKGNSDDGKLDTALIFAHEVVDVVIDGQTHRAAVSKQVGSDPTVTNEVIFKPRKTDEEPTKQEEAGEILLDADWVPVTPDDARDADWFVGELEQRHGIRLHPKVVSKLLHALYEKGFSYLEAKPGPKGYKERFYRPAYI